MKTIAGTQDILRKAWKLVDALAEDCEKPRSGEHQWQKCRRCLAIAELQAEETKLLMRALLTLKQDGRV
jgi:hypothetical protein